MTEAKTVVITGGSAGVGRATAVAFAAAGYQVAVLARGEERLEATRHEIEGRGQRALCLSCDVADAEAVERAAATIEDRLGPIDVWVNNAMATVFSSVDELLPTEVRRVTEVTYLGVVHGTMSALRRMRPRDRGCIIQVGSALAHRSIPLQAAYCGSKHAIVGFTDSLRCELSHDNSGVHVCIVHLPAMNTPQFEWAKTRLQHTPRPGSPVYQPEVAARMILWAATHRRREVLVGWPTVALVNLNKVIPGALDRLLGRIAFEAQETDEPVTVDRSDNLFEAAPGMQTAHGPFDDSAKSRSLQTALSRHRRVVAVGVVATLSGVGTTVVRWRCRAPR